MSNELEKLIDENAIREVVIQYATGIDMRNWELYRACFTDTVEIDFSSWSGGESQIMPGDTWANNVRMGLSGFTSTQHISTNHVITIDEHDAKCVSYMQAKHFFPNDQGDNSYTLGGYYTNTLIKTEQGWKISKCQLTVTWSEGNKQIFELAQQNLQNTTR